jgi:hypothetical protein
MPLVPYDDRFVAVFERELQKRHSPMYPASAWHAALAAADLEQPCLSARHLRFKDRLYNDETSRLSGFAQENIPDGTKKWCAQINRATTRFWAKRYGF